MITVIVASIVMMVFALLWRIASTRRSVPCPAWLFWMVEIDNPLSRINRVAAIIDHLQVKPGMTVVDIGCGPGRVTIPLAHAIGSKGTVIALDMQPAMLEKVKEKADEYTLSALTYVCCTLGIGACTLQSNSVDRAVLVTVLGEIPNQVQALKEIFDVLKPGGILSITEIIFDPHYQRIAHVEQLAQAAGFKKKELWAEWCAYTLNVQKPTV